MSLEEIVKTFRTLRRFNCEKCGNPWWFEYPKFYRCTTCNHEVPR